jgi:hypothetical protein
MPVVGYLGGEFGEAVDDEACQMVQRGERLGGWRAYV